MSLDEYKKKKDLRTGQTWEEFAKARGFTEAEIADGYTWQQRVDAMREEAAMRRRAPMRTL